MEDIERLTILYVHASRLVVALIATATELLKVYDTDAVESFDVLLKEFPS
jgi:hypothetical protein